MNLPSNLISEFAKATKDTKQPKPETTVYGTIVIKDGAKYIKIDGSDLETPIVTTVDAKDGERVVAMIKNHTLVVTGNLSSPAARAADLENITFDASGVYERMESIEGSMATLSGDVDKCEEDIDALQQSTLDINDALTAHAKDIEDLKENSSGGESNQAGTILPVLDTSWVLDSTTGLYSQSFTIAGITEDTTPVIGLVSSETMTSDAEADAYSHIVEAVTTADTLTLYADEALSVAITIVVKGVNASEGSTTTEVTNLVAAYNGLKGTVEVMETDMRTLTNSLESMIVVRYAYNNTLGSFTQGTHNITFDLPTVEGYAPMFYHANNHSWYVAQVYPLVAAAAVDASATTLTIGFYAEHDVNIDGGSFNVTIVYVRNSFS